MPSDLPDAIAATLDALVVVAKALFDVAQHVQRALETALHVTASAALIAAGIVYRVLPDAL